MAKNKYRAQKHILALTALAVALGFCITGIANVHSEANRQAVQENQRLIAYIEEMEQETVALEEQIQATRAQIDAIQNEQAEGESLQTSLNLYLNQLNQQAGATQLTGPGVVITLDDNKAGAELAQKNNPATYNAENYIVHDRDILYLVRALASHTEALAINGIRVVDTTSIRCMGSVIMINSTRLAPPYEISVIGDPAALTEAFYASSRYYHLTYINIPVSIAEAQQLTVPAYTGSLTPAYSTVMAD